RPEAMVSSSTCPRRGIALSCACAWPIVGRAPSTSIAPGRSSSEQRECTASFQGVFVCPPLLDALEEGGHVLAIGRGPTCGMRLNGKAHLNVRRCELRSGKPGAPSELGLDPIEVDLDLGMDEVVQHAARDRLGDGADRPRCLLLDLLEDELEEQWRHGG